MPKASCREQSLRFHLTNVEVQLVAVLDQFISGNASVNGRAQRSISEFVETCDHNSNEDNNSK
jgi:hypothetical protein